MAGNGFFLRAENCFVSAIVQVARCPIRGLVRLERQIKFKILRLPEHLLAAVVDDACRTQFLNGQQ